MDFNKIIGHESIIDYLKAAINKKQVSHSYLFHGEESIGKKMLALSFAKTLLCREEGQGPCNKCISCVKFDHGNHPDFELMEAEKNLISKERLDKLVRNINIAPLEGKRKIIIINDSHYMSLEAQNGLLKTLEEPPAYVNIILITSNINDIIPTILSRCQIVRFFPVGINKIGELLQKNYNKVEEEANFIAHFTKGSVGRSIEIASSEDFRVRREKLIDLVDSIINGGKTNIFIARDFFIDNKDFTEEILDLILYWFRDLAIYKTVGKSELIVNIDNIPLLSKQSYLNIDRIDGIIEGIMKARDNIQGNVNYQLSIETMLLSMQEV